jgi:hypothetical protein
MEGGSSWDIYYTEQRKVIDYLCSKKGEVEEIESRQS